MVFFRIIFHFIPFLLSSFSATLPWSRPGSKCASEVAPSCLPLFSFLSYSRNFLIFTWQGRYVSQVFIDFLRGVVCSSLGIQNILGPDTKKRMKCTFENIHIHKIGQYHFELRVAVAVAIRKFRPESVNLSKYNGGLLSTRSRSPRRQKSVNSYLTNYNNIRIFEDIDKYRSIVQSCFFLQLNLTDPTLN